MPPRQMAKSRFPWPCLLTHLGRVPYERIILKKPGRGKILGALGRFCGSSRAFLLLLTVFYMSVQPGHGNAWQVRGSRSML